jgi:hypothetical protein
MKALAAPTRNGALTRGSDEDAGSADPLLSSEG